ncbi:ATPase family [Emericellopsis cladophorae]|uniref:ATPase family n=1 Tax=Emericellopsis cladophorae TaxID=2686198 RepID=A0A9P9Y7E4_9HYPO|nr:ATPase family [Emericellopsis cladophorae]KAI6784448.1 ATPase family [Emericellopsis cladophorae]
MARRLYSTAVTITDPLVKYQTAVAAGVYAPDPAQHRLALHLRKIYLRIKDYSPQTEYRERLRQVAKLTQIGFTEPEDGTGVLARRNHSIWRNPLFTHLLTSPEGRTSTALTRVLSSHETAIEINSPKGLFLSGEVGTGKSMLLDLLAEGLPTEKKRRWHFNTFMLYTFSQLDSHRKMTPVDEDGVEYSLLWMAKKLVDESPILFLDEFQLPDRAASKILSHLFIAFFQLGGVLIASSNRMPEELQKATGADYTPAPSRGLIRRIFGDSARPKGELFGSSSDFGNFLEVLKARCDFWQMEGARDWRRREEDEILAKPDGEDAAQPPSVNEIGTPSESQAPEEDIASRKKPRHFFLASGEEAESWDRCIKGAVGVQPGEEIPWEPSSVVVYGRRVNTPMHFNGCVFWSFSDLVESFGPADYITMASTYHTFIIDRVPVLTILQKNEARRFITLLDALYEARCKLVVRAEQPPDNLFFPERRRLAKKDADGKISDEDATYSETIAEVYQDTTSPFRPNVSYYDTPSTTSQYDPDQDSDSSSQKTPVDFGNTSAFTGEDERFAYKRATSRLWELCGAQWHARTGDWWQPLPVEARHWEGGQLSSPKRGIESMTKPSVGEGMGRSVDIEEPAGLSRWRVEDLKRQQEQSEKA